MLSSPVSPNSVRGAANSLANFLRRTEWIGVLEPQLALRVEERVVERQISPGTYVYARGMEPASWVGVMDGLLLMCRNSESGKTTAIVPVHAGEWIGEASLMFLRERQFDVVALRASRLACVPRQIFREMYEKSIPFNHYLIKKLAKRVGYLARVVSSDRLLTPVGRTALCLIALLDTHDASGSNRIRITQLEAGQLTGLSRQHVNKALRALREMRIIGVERASVTILDEPALRRLVS